MGEPHGPFEQMPPGEYKDFHHFPHGFFGPPPFFHGPHGPHGEHPLDWPHGPHGPHDWHHGPPHFHGHHHGPHGLHGHHGPHF